MANLRRRLEDLETRAAVIEATGDGDSIAPLTLELWAGDDVDSVVEAARAARLAAGRPILPLPSGIDTIVVIKSHDTGG